MKIRLGRKERARAARNRKRTGPRGSKTPSRLAQTLCHFLGHDWTTNELHSQLSVLLNKMKDMPLCCRRCKQQAKGDWLHGTGITNIRINPNTDRTKLAHLANTANRSNLSNLGESPKSA